MEERTMKLDEVRQEWEEDGEVLLTLTSPSQDVYTLVRGSLKHIQRQWHVFRYNRCGPSWQEHGVVASHFPDIEHCFEYLNAEFQQFYPCSA
jgi:hypothetical protein